MGNHYQVVGYNENKSLNLSYKERRLNLTMIKIFLLTCFVIYKAFL